MLYDRDTRPDLTTLSDDAIVVSTSVLHTGANPPPIKLVLFYGHVHAVDAMLQGAGRSGRSTDEGWSKTAVRADCWLSALPLLSKGAKRPPAALRRCCFGVEVLVNLAGSCEFLRTLALSVR